MANRLDQQRWLPGWCRGGEAWWWGAGNAASHGQQGESLYGRGKGGAHTSDGLVLFPSFFTLSPSHQFFNAYIEY